jgi:hypothetical protein
MISEINKKAMMEKSLLTGVQREPMAGENRYCGIR